MKTNNVGDGVLDVPISADASIEDIVDINKLLPPDAEFYLTDGNFVGLRVKLTEDELKKAAEEEAKAKEDEEKTKAEETESKETDDKESKKKKKHKRKISGSIEDKGRVQLMKMRPFSDENSYISVRDMDLKEIGVVYTIADFPEAQQKIMQDELALRYFTPVVKEITDIKEEYGYTFIKAETSAGIREFVMRDLSNNIVFLSQTKALLIDTDGNRYMVPELKELNDKALRVIGVWA